MPDNETSDGCGFGIGFWAAALFILCLGGSCVRDVGHNFGRGQQEAAAEYQQKTTDAQEQKIKAEALAGQMYREEYDLYIPGK